MGEAALELDKYREQDANMLCPTTKIDGLSDWHDVVVDSISLSVNPDDGDIYKQRDNDSKSILTGQALQKLAVCAGVVWNPRETKATTLEKNYVAYNAVGCIRKTDGQMVCFQAEYDIDMDVIEDEIREKYEFKRREWLDENYNKTWFKKMSPANQKAYVDKKINEELNFKRRHKTKLAATGAKNRVIRALLGIKKGYTAAELQKPFVMPRVIIRPDFSDPEVKRTMMQVAIQSMTGVYGPMPAQIDQSVDDTIDLPDSDYHTVPDDEFPDEPDFPDESDAEPPTTDPRLDFENADRGTQVATLKELAKQKNFPTQVITKAQLERGVTGILYPLDQFNEKARMNLFDKLIAMPDKQDENDRPF